MSVKKKPDLKSVVRKKSKKKTGKKRTYTAPKTIGVVNISEDKKPIGGGMQSLSG